MLIDSTGTPPAYEVLNIRDYVRELVTDPVLVGATDEARLQLVPRQAHSGWRISPALLRHALGNIVRNALRYSTPQSPVTVIIGQRGTRHWIHVLNRGAKIPAEVQARLFEPGKKCARGGMGLGLYIAQTCTERMGGRLFFGTNSRCTVFSLVLEEAADGVMTMLPKSAGLAS